MNVRSLRISSDQLLGQPKQGTNLGLWFQKYLDREKGVPSQVLVGSITDLQEQVDPIYEKFYTNWEEALKKIGAQTEVARTHGRMIVNLGAESVAEVSIALHHTYGMPYIPGTALKGLAAHYANSHLGEAWKKNTDVYKAIFGTGKAAGYVTFHDALFVPDDKFKQPLQKDTVTGHHQDYNKGDDVPPADWDSPNIIPFISVRGKFLIAISGDDAAKQVAMEILRLALLYEGVGAKTSSGYGRMVFESHPDDSIHGRSTTAPMEATETEETYEMKKTRLLENETPPEGWNRGDVREGDIRRGGDFGFITPRQSRAKIFVHKDFFEKTGALVEIGQVLEYIPEPQRDGKIHAKSVKILLSKE